MKSVPVLVIIAALITWAALSSGNVAFAKDAEVKEFTACEVECAADFLACQADNVRASYRQCRNEPTFAARSACLRTHLNTGAQECRGEYEACLSQCEE